MTDDQKIRSVVVMDENEHQIGSGLIFDEGWFITSRHVFDKSSGDLLLRNLNGDQFRVPTTSRFAAKKLESIQQDFAVGRFQDPEHRGPRSPIEVRPLSTTPESNHEVLRVVAEVKGVLKAADTSVYERFPESRMMYYCAPAEKGMSGSPVFDSSGAWVALTLGLETRCHDLCGESSPGYGIPATEILSNLLRTIPRLKAGFSNQHFRLKLHAID